MSIEDSMNTNAMCVTATFLSRSEVGSVAVGNVCVGGGVVGVELQLGR